MRSSVSCCSIPTRARKRGYLRGSHGTFGSGAEVETPRREWASARSEHSAVLAFPEPAKTGSQALPQAGAASTNNAQNSAAFDRTISDRRADGPVRFAEPQAPGGNDTPGPSWPLAETPQPATVAKAAPEGTMARQLREYWQLERTHRSGKVSAEASRAPQVPTAAAPIAASPAKVDERAQSNVQSALARRLRTFVSGQSAEAASGRSAWEAGVEVSSEARSLSESSLAAPTGSQSLDFADRLSTVLRQQALQHGIDVT